MDINRRSSIYSVGINPDIYRTLVADGTPAAPSESGNDGRWGSTLKDLTKDGLQKGVDELKKQGTWKGSDSSVHGSSSSLGNVGGEKLPDNLSKLGAWGKGKTIAEFEWHAARVGAVDYKDSGDWGSVYVKGATDFLKIQGRVYGNVGFNDWTATAGGGVQGRIEIVGSHYEAGYKSPSFYNLGGHNIDLETKVNADAQVGVNGFAEAEVGVGKNTHLDLGAGGFEGASASLGGSESLGDFGSVNGQADVWAGVGAKADVDVGLKGGKFSFHFGAGLALGIGAEYDWGFSIDFAAIGDSLYHVGSDLIDGIGDAGDWIGCAAGDVADWTEGAAETVGNAAEDAVDAVGDAAGDVVDAAGDAADAVGDFVSSLW
jgi:hypothetical protein